MCLFLIMNFLFPPTQVELEQCFYFLSIINLPFTYDIWTIVMYGSAEYMSKY